MLHSPQDVGAPQSAVLIEEIYEHQATFKMKSNSGQENKMRKVARMPLKNRQVFP